MSIMEYNGSGIVAMTGKNCVAIASDMRYGIQQQTIADNMHKIFPIHEHCYIGISGLATDMITVKNKLNLRTKLYELREERKIRPSIFANMVSSLLYEHRFGPYFVEPVVCGLEDPRVLDGKLDIKPDGRLDVKSEMDVKDLPAAPAAPATPAKAAAARATGPLDEKTAKPEKVPFICAMDLIGAPVYTTDFVVAGTCSEQLYGCAEAFYKKDMNPDELFETISQTLLAAVDRDCLAGWGAIVHIITADKCVTKTLKTRKD